MRRGLRAIAATIALLALALAPAAALAQQPTPGQQPPPDPAVVVPASVEEPLEQLRNPADEVKLSDEEAITRWAHAQDTVQIRSTPVDTAKAYTRLRFFTEDRLAEVYVVLAGRMDSAGRPWLQIRVPMRPNGRVGWVPAEALSQLYVVRTKLVVDRKALRAKLYKEGKVIWQAPVGIGASATPTPRGVFWIRERLRGLGDGTSYGPWAFGTSAYSNLSDWPGGGVVGIHGTNAPQLIPGRPSHGCIRVRNAKIRQLARLMPIGTPVHVIR